MTDRLKELKAKSDATGAGQVAIEIGPVGGGSGERESLVLFRRLPNAIGTAYSNSF